MPKKIEILKESSRLSILIITGIFPPDIGGPATYVPQIASALTKRGHRVTLITLSDYISDDTYPFRVVRLLRGIFKPWRWALTVWTLIRWGKNAEILFVNGLAMEAAVANIILRKPMLMKNVGDFAWERARSKGWIKENFEEFQKKRYGLKVEILRTLRNWWTRQADAIIVPSRFLAQWVSGWNVPKKNIVVIYNAVESTKHLQPIQIPLREAFKVATVGRLTSWKRIDGIIEAIAQLENVGLIVVGDGPEEERLKQMAQALNVSERIYFAGKRSKQETLSLMAAADIFVLNSTYEGLPHVVLEAMSLGLPVVATTIGGTPEVVEHETNGLLIPSSDHEALKDALSRLIAHPTDLHSFSEGAKSTSRRFGFERMVKETEMLLTEIAQERGAALGATNGRTFRWNS